MDLENLKTHLNMESVLEDWLDNLFTVTDWRSLDNEKLLRLIPIDFLSREVSPTRKVR